MRWIPYSKGSWACRKSQFEAERYARVHIATLHATRVSPRSCAHRAARVGEIVTNRLANLPKIAVAAEAVLEAGRSR